MHQESEDDKDKNRIPSTVTEDQKKQQLINSSSLSENILQEFDASNSISSKKKY